MARAVPIPIPLNGLNTVSPDLPLEAGYARELTNYSLINGRLRMRSSIEKYNTVTLTVSTSFTARPVWYSIGANTATSYAIIGFSNTSNASIRRISDNTEVATITGGIDIEKMATQLKHVSLNLVIGVGEPRDIDYPFTAWTFNTIGITESAITSACSHKGRLYVSDGSTIEYSNVGQVTGTMAGTFDISQFMDGQGVLRMFSTNLSGNNTAENILVVFGNAGKVLVYAGDYPASSTWNLIGNYDMPPPNTRASFVQVDGDIWVLTTEYVYWFSILFGEGVQSARDNSPSIAIQNLIQDQKASLLVEYEETDGCFYISELDAICCSYNVFANASTWAKLVPTQFFTTPQPASLLYFRKYKAWGLWLTPEFSAPFRSATTGRIYAASAPVNSGGAGIVTYNLYYTDPLSYSAYDGSYGNTPITTSWKTPFINAFAGKIQKVVGCRPFFQSSLNGYLEKLRIIFDYSDYNSPYGFYTQPTATQINPENYSDANIDVPTQQSDNYSPYSSISGSGGGVSLQITQQAKSGSNSSQLNEIYAATLYVQDGGDMI